MKEIDAEPTSCKEITSNDEKPTLKGIREGPPTFPNIILTAKVETTPKHQHFSREFFLFADRDRLTSVGCATARYIDRNRLRSLKSFSFHKALESFNGGESDGSNFAVDLFYDNGSFKNKHKQHGPWGKELSSGGVLILGFLLVKKEFRRQGMAAMLINGLIEKAKKTKGGAELMVVFPGVIYRDLEEGKGEKSVEDQEAVEKRAYDNAVGFYRSMGFRRIGITKWFGLALDSKHPSHLISADNDTDIY